MGLKEIFKQADNQEWYTPIEPIREYLDLINIPKDKIIWCPCDTMESNFVKELRSRGYLVIASHISWGSDFYNFEPEKWDILITNPPFKHKRLFIERCLSFNKPFHLLYGCSIFCQSLGNTLNKCDFYFIQKAIKFFNGDKTNKFLCCWIRRKPCIEKK